MIISRISFAFMLACALVAPLGLHAQRERPLQRREIEGTAAASLHDAIAAARPAWLLVAGDTANAAAAGQVLVFVDGAELGDLRALRTVLAARVESVSLRSAALVRRTHPRLAGRDFVAALFVSTRVERDPTARVRRLSVSLNAGAGIVSQGSHVRSRFAEQGYYSVLPAGQAWAREGTESPFTYGAVVHYAARGRLGAELEVQHTPEAFFGGVRGDDQPVVSGFFTTSEAAVMATFTRTGARAGLGVAYRTTRWELSRAFCQCQENRAETTSAPGLAGGVTLQLPAQARWFVQLRGQARWFPSHQSPGYTGPGEMDVGGVTVHSGVGLGLRF